MEKIPLTPRIINDLVDAYKMAIDQIFTRGLTREEVCEDDETLRNEVLKICLADYYEIESLDDGICDDYYFNRYIKQALVLDDK